MRFYLRFASITVCSLLLLSGPAGGAAPFKILVFSKTTGFRHDSIPNGITALQALGATNNFNVDATEDSTVFTDANLAQYKAVVFLLTTGTILTDDQKAAFQRFIEAGNGWVGIHSAADTEYTWVWYGELLGAYFASHPAIQTATIKVADRQHPSTAPLPKVWVRNDELYNFQTNPRGKVHVLATLDERTYTGGTMGFDHPISWCAAYDGGRSWYTGLGHTQQSYAEPLFLAHLLGGILYAAGIVPFDARQTLDSSFQKVVLDNKVADPLELAVANDGRVFFIERGGKIKIYKPDLARTVIAGFIPVSTTIEDGLLGITLDPGFDTNQWIYVFYSPAGTVPEQHISRFTVQGDTLDMSSEKILLKIPTQRDQCCHSGGSLIFGNNGELYISVGDNTNPFESAGFDPIDERPGRSPWDSQKSASNPADLRGKILRIHPETNGAYSIPAGNLFPPDNSQGKAEIYIMGCRNPYRSTVDSETGWLYWGEVGPDAVADDPSRGPKGYDEWNQARAAGNFGWPYFVANNQAYVDYDFATGLSGAPFDPNNPVNDSPNNTGATNLPPAMPPLMWYPYDHSVEFPELDGGAGRTAMSGPVYHYDPSLNSTRKLPPYYDKTLFAFEWSRAWIKEVKFDDSGNVLKINSFDPSLVLKRPIDMKTGPDGAIYMIEWGSIFGGGNSDSQLIRLDYIGGIPAPTMTIGVARDGGLQLVWPAVPVNYQLMQSATLPFGASAVPVSATPVTNDGQVSVTVTNDTQIRYFQLRTTP